MRRFLFLLVIAGIAIGIGLSYRQFRPSEEGAAYRFAAVERGALQMAVSSTGQVNPVVTVQVGTQVSGQISELSADFNTPVKAGQIIARIDPASFEARVATARAELLVAGANVSMQRASVSELQAEMTGAIAAHKDSRQDLARKQALLTRRVVADSVVEKAIAARDQAAARLAVFKAKLQKQRAQLQSAGAQVQSRQAILNDRKLDLEHAIVRSPVDGVVINRDVDLGQTVAASLQAQVLFSIAQDLRHMQIEVSVDEADIGRVSEGQRVNFTVDAYPQREFSGEVLQIRKSPKFVSNVVTYTVITSAANPDYALLPGMTASVEIVIGARRNILKVPNAALRFKPPGAGDAPQGRPGPEGARQRAQAMIENLTKSLSLSDEQQAGVREIFRQTGQAIRGVFQGDTPADQRREMVQQLRAKSSQRITQLLDPEQLKMYKRLRALSTAGGNQRGRVWISGADGVAQSVNVVSGLSDGAMTEIVSGDLADDARVIVGIASKAR